MKFFALETDSSKIKQDFLTVGEQEIFTVRQHIMGLLSKIVWHSILTLVVIALTIFFLNTAADPTIVVSVATIGWFIFLGIPLIRDYIDWRFDFVFLTTDKLVIVEQFSLFKKTITPISLENLGDVVARTQWLNLFNFGIIDIALKEGNGPFLTLKFIPNAEQVVAKISEQMTLYQRRKDFVIPYRNSGGEAL